MSNPFEGLLSFGEASAEWGLNESTLRRAVFDKRLKEDEEIRKFGKQWVITREAMERHYGPPGQKKK
jgi:hypothetical protein